MPHNDANFGIGTLRMICVKNLNKRYRARDGDVPALADVDIEVSEGEFVTIVGPSGCGKSTLLYILGGFLGADGGTIEVDGKAVTGPGVDRGIVFQEYALFPWLTVLGNIAYGLEMKGLGAAERDAIARRYITLIGLEGFENRFPRELSGGMRQRVGFARALVVDPTLLLMDEPFSALDVLTAENLRTDLLDLWTQGRMPIKSVLIVTHNIEEAVFMCDRILVLSSNPGRVMAEIKVPFKHPRNRLDPAFRRLVDDIYAKMTARQLGEATKKGLELGSWLPNVSTNLMAGLIETLAAEPYHGRADMPEIARSLHLEVDDLFPIAEVLQHLGFADVREGDIYLTPPARVFAEFGTQERKMMFAEHLLRHVPLAARIKKVLNERPGHRAPRVRFEQELEDFLSDKAAEETLDAVIEWGRYGEIFSYNDQTEMLSLEDVES